MMPGLVGTLLLLPLMGCQLTFMESEVILTNTAAAPLTSGKLVVTGQTLWAGTLAPGATERVSYSPAGDGSFFLTGQVNGVPVRPEAVGYTTPNERRSHTLTITPEGTVAHAGQPR